MGRVVRGLGDRCRQLKGDKKRKCLMWCKNRPNSKRCKKTRNNKPKSKKNGGKGNGNGNGNGNGKGKGKGKGRGKGKGKKEKKIAKQLKNREKKLARRLKTLSRKQSGKKNIGNLGSKANNRASTVNLTCLTTAVQLLKFQKDNVNNFLARHTRQIKQNALTTKKQGKKGEFAEPAARLIQAGGGNKSNLTCGGSTTSAGAKQLLNLTNLLDGCSAAIKDACTPPSGINQTFMTECYEKSKGYNTTLSGCVSTAISGSDPCSCFTSQSW